MSHLVRPLFFAALLFVLMPSVSYAATKPKLEISGWIPYWRTATGTADTLAHLNSFTEINPFGYTVKTNGELNDAAGLSQEPWTSLIAAAKQKKIRVIPTVMWGNTNAIHAVLSNTKNRIALEDTIARTVQENNFDGIDIDFEGKKAEDKNYFSTFLKGLYQRMGKKWVMCTIEARTPVGSRYDGIAPSDATEYSNDYVAINKYCDRVRIMAYDQGTIDVKLNQANAGPYIPVSDPKWVTKVITLAAQQISKKKLVLGIPTYGYEFLVTPLKDGYRYDLQWAFNQKYALDLARQLGLTAVRNSAGELSFSYLGSLLAGPSASEFDGMPSSDARVPTTAYSSGTSSPAISPSFNIVWWSDAKAVADKVALAKKLGLRGVAIFKIDGGEDPNMWSILK